MERRFILTGKHGRPSTKEAFKTVKRGELIQRRQFTKKKTKKFVKYYRVFDKDNRDFYRKEYHDPINASNSIVIRWGTQEAITTNNKTVVYNKIPALKNATNKKLSRELMFKAGVSIPKIVTKKNYKNSNYPLIARPLEHSKGKNFYVYNTPKDFENKFDKNTMYCCEFIDKTNEFRIHAGHSKVLAVMEKIKPQDPNQKAWNRAQNDIDPFEYVKWSDVDNRKIKCVLDEALKALDALELDMGGVDVMLKDNKAYVLEVNTAPTLNSSPYVASRWGLYWDWLFNRVKRRPHWDYKKFKKGQSMIWKNYQLKDKKKN